MVAAAIEAPGPARAEAARGRGPHAASRRRWRPPPRTARLPSARRPACAACAAIGGERARVQLEALLARQRHATTRCAPPRPRSWASSETSAAEGALASALDDWTTTTCARRRARRWTRSSRRSARGWSSSPWTASRRTSPSPPPRYLASEGDPALLVPRLATLENAELRQRLRRGLVRRGRAARPEVSRAARPRQARGARGSRVARGRPHGRAGHARAWSRGHGHAGAARSRPPSAAPPPSGPPRPRRSASRWPAPGSGCCGRARGWASTELATRRAGHLQGGEAKAPAERAPGSGPGAGPAERPPPEALRAALADPDAEVREAAAIALAAHRPRARRRAGRWRCSRSTRWPWAPRARAVRSPKRSPPSEARRMALPAVLAGKELEPLRPLATNKESQVRQDALGRAGPPGRNEAAELLRGRPSTSPSPWSCARPPTAPTNVHAAAAERARTGRAARREHRHPPRRRAAATPPRATWTSTPDASRVLLALEGSRGTVGVRGRVRDARPLPRRAGRRPRRSSPATCATGARTAPRTSRT